MREGGCIAVNSPIQRIHEVPTCESAKTLTKRSLDRRSLELIALHCNLSPEDYHNGLQSIKSLQR